MRVNFFSQSGTKPSAFDQGLSATLTGPLVLAGNPTGPLEAAPKQYVDSAVNSLNAANIKTGTIPIGRLPAFTGDVSSATGAGNFVLNNTGVIAGTYTKITTDSKGRVLNGGALTNDDIPPFNWNKISSNKPTTIAGYGITNGLSVNGGTVDGTLTLNNDPTANLHAANKQYVDALNNNGVSVTTGAIIRRPTNTTPAGFLRCNGGEISKATYSALYETIASPYITKQTLDYTSYAVMGAGQPWRQQYDFNSNQNADITDWTSATALPMAISDGMAFVTNNRAYLVGGWSTGGGNYLSTVYTAPINADGTLGTWTTSTALPETIYAAQVVVTKNRVYLLGGVVNGTNSSTVYTAPINTDGTLGAWTTTTSLPMTLVYPQTVVTKNKVYLLGGYTSGGPINTVHVAPINSDGTLGAWTTTTSLPEKLSLSQAIVTKNRVYLLGGNNASSDAISTVYTAPINSDGTIGTWTVGSSLPGPMRHAQSVITKNRVFIFSGWIASGNYVRTVYTAPINTDGTLGAWTTATNLPIYVSDLHTIVTKNRIYLLGGSDYNTGPRNSVYTASFSGGVNDYSNFYNGTINKFDGSNISGSIIIQDSYRDTQFDIQPGNGQPWRQQYDINTTQDGTLTGWNTHGNLPATIGYAQAIVTKNRVYIMGGQVDSNWSANVYTAPINDDGTLGAWTSSSPLPDKLGHSQAIVTKNRVYLLGGHNNTNVVSTVYTAPINADGTLGTWTTATGLPSTLMQSHAIVTKNRVYIMGGQTNSGSNSSSIYTAPINADGTLGTWNGAGSLPAVIRAAQIVVTKNRVYLLGGEVNGIYRDTVHTAPINADGTLGAWTTGTSLPVHHVFSQSVVTRKRVYLIGGFAGGSYTGDVFSAPINADGTLGTWSQATGATGFIAHSQVIATSSKIYTLGGEIGSFVSTIRFASFSGSLNDYSPYYNGAIIAIDKTNNFRLPDFSTSESTSEFYFIKT